jgi:hypothetical protein
MNAMIQNELEATAIYAFAQYVLNDNGITKPTAKQLEQLAAYVDANKDSIVDDYIAGTLARFARSFNA